MFWGGCAILNCASPLASVSMRRGVETFGSFSCRTCTDTACFGKGCPSLPLIARTLTLSNTEITQKSGVLEQFWSKAKAKPNVYIPALRQELANLQNPPFFLYDGSMLLLSLSNTPIDRKVALAAIAHNDVRGTCSQETTSFRCTGWRR